MARLQLASLLNSVGMNLTNSGNQEKGLEAFLGGAQQTQLIQNPQEVMPRLQLASVLNSVGMNSRIRQSGARD